MPKDSSSVECPVCARQFPSSEVEDHVNRCLFLKSPSSSQSTPTRKRTVAVSSAPVDKKQKQSTPATDEKIITERKPSTDVENKPILSSSVPLAERMRPASLQTYVGQTHVLGEKTMLRELLEKGEVPSIILWGPPGCGKTSLANVVAAMCERRADLRFVKLSASTAGIADVKEVVAQARNELKFKRKTILFMDEIHRFNKLQQDAFLPHVETGVITLLGATTENPSFSLTAALLSRCRVLVLDKLRVDDVLTILARAVRLAGPGARLAAAGAAEAAEEGDAMPRVLVEESCLRWLAEVCDGDARVALGGLQLALQACDPGAGRPPALLTLQHVQEGVKRSHTLYARAGDQHYDMISALHKSIRASDDSAALYWLCRMLQGGEDPAYVARRLVRAASEDIGVADAASLPLAVACLQGVRQVGAPESDVLLAHCAVHLARAPKSTAVYHALLAARQAVRDQRGPLPPVPLHLRNAPTKLMEQLGYGSGYNARHKDESQLTYMPEGLEDVDFFHRA